MRPAEAGALRAGQLWAPLLLLPIALSGLLDPVFAETLDIDEPWEALCLAVSGAGVALRMLVAAHEREAASPDTTGIHSLMRHPLALGNFLIWAGIALFPRSWPAACGGLFVAAILCRRGMARHDAWLQAQPGAWLQAWRLSTPSVLPRWASWRPPATPFSWRLAMDRESATLFATMAAFLLLELAGEVVVNPEPQVDAAWAVMLAAAALPCVLSRLLAWQSRTASAAPATPATVAIEQDRWLLLLVVGFVALLAWDASGADLLLAGWFGGPHGFGLRNSPVFAGVLHEGGRLAAWAVVAWIAVGIARPTGELRLLSRRERAWLLSTVVASLLFVTLLKRGSSTTCPWDVAGFGGMAPYVPHWHLHTQDGGAGHCFPAGHAAGGYALVAGYFAFRHRDRRASKHWLLAALAFGTVLGVGQQVRGAHFASHTLWTAWICCVVAWASATLFLRRSKGPR